MVVDGAKGRKANGKVMRMHFYPEAMFEVEGIEEAYPREASTCMETDRGKGG